MTEISPAGHVLYALRNAHRNTWPFPHFYAANVFADDFYLRLLSTIDEKSAFQAKAGHYPGRTFAKTEGLLLLDFMQTRGFLSGIAALFPDALKKRFADRQCTLYSDVRLVRDGQGYSIGPHTDAPWKVLSLLFYLPRDNWHHDAGTSLYLPRDPEFTCPGGPHHKFENFKRITTTSYSPNTCFGFFKTDNSFHGVEPINTEFKRDVLLYNIYDKQTYDLHHPITT